jgi:hypothetical protein
MNNLDFSVLTSSKGSEAALEESFSSIEVGDEALPDIEN